MEEITSIPFSSERIHCLIRLAGQAKSPLRTALKTVYLKLKLQL